MFNSGFTSEQYFRYLDELANDLGSLGRLCAPHTMTSLERMTMLREAVRHVASTAVPGAFVECGVWRGGSTMLAAAEFLESGAIRDIHVFDTFTGMTAPTGRDVDWAGRSAAARLAMDEHQTGYVWAVASREEFLSNFLSTGYPRDALHIHEGDIRETAPTACIGQIAILRLDTDWYETTLVELEAFWPAVAVGGLVIIDDYGYWQGARAAVDEFLERLRTRPLRIRIDFSGLLIQKGSVAG